MPLAYLAMHLGWGLGFWEGALRRAIGAVGQKRRAPDVRSAA